jgi:hypothetical protein
MLSRETIHLFCRVVDNFGDIGVCWRQAFKSNVLVIVGFLVELGYCLFEYSLKESLFRYLAAIVVGMFDTWRRGPEPVFCRQMIEKKRCGKSAAFLVIG